MASEAPIAERETLQQGVVDVLQWYRTMGVEDALEATAVDWLARGDTGPGAGFSLGGTGETVPRPPIAGVPSSPAPPPVRPPLGTQSAAAAPAPRQFPTASPDAAVTAARAAAREAASLDELRAKLEAFNGCALKATAKNLCFFRGSPRARLMLIGEAPGRDEDISGTPFVGRAGQLLDRMLAAVGLDDSRVHITNTVYWRPPGNRTPSPQETQSCRPFLDRQIELVEPEFIGLLGGAAANQVLGVEGGIMRLRGKWRGIEIGGRQIPVIATLHPAFLLRTPLYKRQAWRDMLAIAAALDGAAPAIVR